MNVQSRPLKVAALGMEQRTYNTLQLFFSDRCEDQYVLCDENSADIIIIDMDGYQAASVLESHKKNHPHQPAILVSLKEKLAQDSVFVRKPIQMSALALALLEAKKRLENPKSRTPYPARRNNVHYERYSVENSVDNTVNNVVEQRHEPFPGVKTTRLDTGVRAAEVRADSARGGEARMMAFSARNSGAVTDTGRRTYSGKPAGKTADKMPAPKIQYFVHTERLKAIQEESKKILKSLHDRSQPPIQNFKAKPIPKPATEYKPGVNDSGIRFVGDLNAIFNPRNPSLTSKLQYNADMSLQGYVALAYKIALSSSSNVMVEGPWRPIHILYKTREICVERDFRHLFALSAMTFKKEEISIYGMDPADSFVPSEQMVVQPIEQFLWKLALRTSQGRIPIGTELETPVKLIRWPSFTRYEVTPHALRIAALWIKQPTSLVETAKILMIPQQYVFAFYSATHATNMVSYVKEDSPEAPIVVTDVAHRTLLQNLLDRLRR